MAKGVKVTELDEETRKKLNIEVEPSLEVAGIRHIALGKVLKDISKIEEDDALWVLQQARRSLGNQGDVLTTDNTSDYVPSISWTLQVVARCSGISVTEIKQRSRTEEVVTARQVAMYVLSMTGGYTLTHIGRAMGGRTPATVSHGFQKIATRVNSDKGLANLINTIKQEL